MFSQERYYNRFGAFHRQSILSCPEPEYWTTDYAEQGRVYREMKERIKMQQQLADDCFSIQFPVLDVGCGFGRQAVMLAKKGYEVVGCDTSEVFISIAKELFDSQVSKASFSPLELISYKEGISARLCCLMLLNIFLLLKEKSW
jgi:SAM-dependent methyltransferase